MPPPSSVRRPSSLRQPGRLQQLAAADAAVLRIRTALSVVQQLALSREMTIPSAITAAQAAAASALVRASLTLPVNTADIAAKAKALADAELALADARAAAFERVQKSLQPLNAAQIATYARGAGAGGGGRGGGGRGGAAASWETAYYDHTGFIQLFDGKTLNGWDGEAGKWDVQDGAIHRHQTLVPKNFVDFGQYHLHYKEVFADFDLKVEFKIKSGNAGIQYRGRLESGIHAQDGEPAREAAGGGGGARRRHSAAQCRGRDRRSARQAPAREYQDP